MAGFIDAVGYITLDRLFTAHMSGNTAWLGVFLGHGDPLRTLTLAVILFILGGIWCLYLAGAAWGSSRASGDSGR